jgi:hypothetical protein
LFVVLLDSSPTFANREMNDLDKTVAGKELHLQEEDVSGTLKASEPWYPRQHHARGAPIFELSSVRVSVEKYEKLYGNDRHIELYGDITLVVDNVVELYLFRKCESDALHVDLLKDNEDILRGFHNIDPPLLPENFRIDLNLLDKKQQNLLIKQSIDINYSEATYDKEIWYDLECGFASLTYTIFPYAVLAGVNIFLTKNNDLGNDSSKELSGTISVKYKLRNTTASRTLCDDFYVDSSIFPLECNLRWLPVPAYSSVLEVKADLKVDGDNVNVWREPLTFKVCDMVPFLWDKKTFVVNEQLGMEVRVNWKHPFCLHKGGGLPNEPGSKKLDTQPLPSEQNYGIFYSGDSSFSLTEHIKVSSLVEVFSIYVHTYSYNGQLCLHGTIEASDGLNEMNMFERGKNEAVNVKSGGHLPLTQVNHCYKAECFEINLDLKGDDGREIIKGSLSYGATRDAWVGKQICSVIAGIDGYAAVHYSLFNRALQAKVKIVFYSKGKRPALVYGKIRTWYTGYRYSSCHEKKYQSVLFENERSNCVTVDDSQVIHLSKAVVAVPVYHSLAVGVDLSAFVDDTRRVIHKLEGTLFFEPLMPTKKERLHKSEPKEISGSSYSLDATVEWGFMTLPRY